MSAPDLPVRDIHYQEFGYLLSVVQSGCRFQPLTPKNVEEGTLPTYRRNKQVHFFSCPQLLLC